ncbi:MAG: helix-turn-helix transcriptional regulator [Mesorhizobium sp.]|nr:MAG: helix-turn-helix transcriptional regulator [Mesorhizobium sp.]RWL95357.1 MAG: helix-turn-helix transcriptional regulator [Mesorhizobium sp.]
MGPEMQFAGDRRGGWANVSEGRWQHLTRELDAAVLDASRWKNVCDALAAITGGAGTALIPFDRNHRGAWIIKSDAIGGLMETYVRDGWYKRDLREAAWPIMRRKGFATDFDLVDQDMMCRHPYYQDFLARGGASTFIGIHIPTQGDDWVAAIQLPAGAGTPGSHTIELLPRLRTKIADAVRSAQAMAASGVENWASFFEGTDRGIALLTRDGQINKMNAAAERLLMPFVGRGGEIKLGDPKAARQLTDLTGAACAVPPRSPLPPPVLLSLAPGKFLSFEAVPLPSGLRHFCSDLAAVLVVRMAATAVAEPHIALAERFRLTPSEARLALHIGSGTSVREAAGREGIAFETARSRLKAIYAKTGARRQSELALLVSKIGRTTGDLAG